MFGKNKTVDKKRQHTTGGLAIWRGDEYIFSTFCFSI